ncbi:unnamed protein product [Anisakis simplex]|uniref:Variant Ionotropic Glutamate Receptor n=1 Tax=Anisakis simplex TaxID=6269 RepID=A0A0M3KAB8_ANISI|nr:unnamed protein product [Anisakis simplex]
MFPSGGRYAAHALGYTPYSFSAMARSVTAIQEFNMFGIPFVGADVCSSVTPNWIRKDQYSMPTIDPKLNLIFSLFRKRNSPYMYTLFFEAARSGGTVIRPLFFEFPNDDAARLTYQQFMLGPALLFTPVLSMVLLIYTWRISILKGANETYAYFPRDASWYYFSGSEIDRLYSTEVESGYRFVHSDQTSPPPAYIRGYQSQL